ncbi:MAG: hypothetical protein BWY85_01420 [Firmicutes bacterium ADurb.Bin506]|nr:MAG: hypothetical protein BWY85_01420 [Firmicutes bacterium ADurb.Bin506]
MATRSRCTCGKVKAAEAHTCKACYIKARDARHAEARAIVATGVCPDCGLPLKRNLSLAGWWQCVRCTDYPAPEYAQYPKCSFQTFTD